MGVLRFSQFQIPCECGLTSSLRAKREEFIAAQYRFAYSTDVNIASHELVLVRVRLVARIAHTEIKLTISHISLKSTIGHLRVLTSAIQRMIDECLGLAPELRKHP